ncbi:hypothetical protein K443DRAFT_2250 [Laccaria amethystina LaAM-08-1]|jgi:hypothetical protein|uniref:Uncharacterized protein n=1 Tax=Laccaria amethystina LaAM-08-1 TaxID=1095629 RepID=A0A0C9YI47_9AGAR|nr:hypothetical protein K443DRAFT_2250 [Laccaria amethystina LaAM-08-1]
MEVDRGAHFIQHKPTTTTTIIVVVVVSCSSSSLAPPRRPSSLDVGPHRLCPFEDAGGRLWAVVVVWERLWALVVVWVRFDVFVPVSGRSSSFLGVRLRSWSVGVDVVAARTLAVGAVFRLWPRCRWGGGGGVG